MATTLETAFANVAASIAGPALSAEFSPAVGALVAAAIREVPEVVDEIEKVIAAWRGASSSGPSVKEPLLDFKDESASLEAQLHPVK